MKIKKSVARLVTAMMLMSSIVVPSFASTATTVRTLSISDPSVQAGGQVTVDIKADDLTGIDMMNFEIGFPNTKLEYVSTTFGPDFPADGTWEAREANATANSVVVLLFPNMGDAIPDGITATGERTICSITFKAIGTAPTTAELEFLRGGIDETFAFSHLTTPIDSTKIVTTDKGNVTIFSDESIVEAYLATVNNLFVNINENLPVTKNVVTPPEGVNVTITDGSNIVTERPAYGELDTTQTFTITATKGDYSNTKVVTINVMADISPLQKFLLDAMVMAPGNYATLPAYDAQDPYPAFTTPTRAGFVKYVLEPLVTKTLKTDITPELVAYAASYFEGSVSEGSVKIALENFVIQSQLNKDAATTVVLDGFDNLTLVSTTGFESIKAAINRDITGDAKDDRGIQLLTLFLRETVTTTFNGTPIGPVAFDQTGAVNKIDLHLPEGSEAQVTKISNLLNSAQSLMNKINNTAGVTGTTNYAKLLSYSQNIINAQSDAEIAAFKNFLKDNSETGNPIYQSAAPSVVFGDATGDNVFDFDDVMAAIDHFMGYTAITDPDRLYAINVATPFEGEVDFDDIMHMIDVFMGYTLSFDVESN